MCHWSRLESYTATGIPDLSGCYKGNEAWFELKVLTTRNDKSYPPFRPLQIAWQTLRTQHGGRVYNLVHHPSSQMLLIIDGKNLGARLMDGDVLYDAKRPINMDQKAWQVLFSQMFSGEDGWMDWRFYLNHIYMYRHIYSNILDSNWFTTRRKNRTTLLLLLYLNHAPYYLNN